MNQNKLIGIIENNPSLLKYINHYGEDDMSVNRVILVGHLGQDPEARSLNDGSTVVNFSLATDESYKNKKGNKVDKVTWHKLVAFGKLADIVSEYLTKGSLVYVEGKIQIKEYVDKNNQKRTSFEIVANNLRMLGGGSKQTEVETEVETETQTDTSDESIPF